MTTDQYKIEWLLDSDDDLSEAEKKQLIEDFVNTLDVEDEIKYGGQYNTRSISTFDVSIGIFLVSSLQVAIKIYETLKERDDSNIGIKQVNNEKFFINEVNAENIENYNGDIIANVEGDVHFHTLPDDMDDYIELRQELRENEDEGQ